MPDLLKGPDIAQHNSAQSCWVIVHGRAYDVTDFLPEHPGGQKVIMRWAGRDATAEFEPIHPPDTLDRYLPADKHLGPVDMSTVQADETEEAAAAAAAEKEEEKKRLQEWERRPLLDQCYNLLDFEAIARRVMKKTAWAYYSSAADDEITLRENHTAFHRIFFRPRVLVPVTHVDPSSTFLGVRVSCPFYVTATALAKLGHPDGEVVLTRAAHTHAIIQMIPTLASCSLNQILDAARPEQTQWLQLYVNRDRAVTRQLVEHAERRGCRGLFVTVDAPQLGRREKDMRVKFVDPGPDIVPRGEEEAEAEAGRKETTWNQGAARAISGFIDPGLGWEDIKWLQRITRMPVVLKGVQRVEDVLRAVEMGIPAVVLSNHGGRQLDTARSGIEVLAETMPELRRRGLDRRIEVYIDGGIRRATDMVKALCLGARGVGIGRPFLYAMASYGQAGVERAMQLLKDEMEMNMRLVGARTVDELTPDLIDARGVFSHAASGGVADHLAMATYDPLVSPPQRPGKESKL